MKKENKRTRSLDMENFHSIDFVNKYDPEVGSAMLEEQARQRRNLELIASENIVA